MVNNYYTLRALVREWRPDLTGTTVRDVYSQTKNELTVALRGSEQDWMVRGSVQRPFLYLFRRPGYHKARRNVATLFENAVGQGVQDVRIADRDRLVYFDLEDGTQILWQLFGARANVFRVAPDGTIRAAFQRHDELVGTEAPEPYPAPMPETFDTFDNRWKDPRNKTRQAVQSAVPLFGAELARETLHRAGVTTDAPEDCTEAERRINQIAGHKDLLRLREALQPELDLEEDSEKQSLSEGEINQELIIPSGLSPDSELSVFSTGCVVFGPKAVRECLVLPQSVSLGSKLFRFSIVGIHSGKMLRYCRFQRTLGDFSTLGAWRRLPVEMTSPLKNRLILH